MQSSCLVLRVLGVDEEHLEADIDLVGVGGGADHLVPGCVPLTPPAHQAPLAPLLLKM